MLPSTPVGCLVVRFLLMMLAVLLLGLCRRPSHSPPRGAFCPRCWCWRRRCQRLWHLIVPRPPLAVGCLGPPRGPRARWVLCAKTALAVAAAVMVAASLAAAAGALVRLGHLHVRWSSIRRAGWSASRWHPVGATAAVSVAPSAVAEALVPCRTYFGLPRVRRPRRASCLLAL